MTNKNWEDVERMTLKKYPDQYLHDYLMEFENLLARQWMMGYVDEWSQRHLQLAREEYDRRNDPL